MEHLYPDGFSVIYSQQALQRRSCDAIRGVPGVLFHPIHHDALVFHPHGLRHGPPARIHAVRIRPITLCNLTRCDPAHLVRDLFRLRLETWIKRAWDYVYLDVDGRRPSQDPVVLHETRETATVVTDVQPLAVADTVCTITLHRQDGDGRFAGQYRMDRRGFLRPVAAGPCDALLGKNWILAQQFHDSEMIQRIDQLWDRALLRRSA